MPRATSTDYTGRQVDVELLQTVEQLVSPLRVHPALSNEPAKVVTGMQKLAQRFTVLLLTILEDVHLDPTQGTTLMQDLLWGAAQNAGTVAGVVSFALLDTVTQLRDEEGEDELYGELPDDEKIDTAILEDFDVDVTNGSIFLRVALTNQVGEDYTYVLPIAVARR